MSGSSKSQPLVTIGLPVYNGQNYVSQAIESVLNQTYSNFELVISDNGSTDSTYIICKTFAEKDNRILCHKFDKNYGAAKNYNKTFELAKGKYFKWLAHDDMISPENLTKSVDILESEDDVVLCGSAKINLDANGGIIDSFDYSGLHLIENDTISRYELLLRHFAYTFTDADLILTGLMRSDILKQTILIANYTSADFTLLADLILKGKFIVLEEPMYQRRIHHGISTSVHNQNPQEALKIDPSIRIVHKSHVEIAKWYDPKGKARRIPHITWLKELIRSIKKNKFRKHDEIKMRMMSYKWFFTRAFKSLKEKIQKWF
jgi:glycosyltransferase involved in cell wall biosynthesis